MLFERVAVSVNCGQLITKDRQAREQILPIIGGFIGSKRTMLASSPSCVQAARPDVMEQLQQLPGVRVIPK